jgi:phage-related protein
VTNSVALAIKVTADAKAAQAGLDGVTQKTSRMGQAGKVAGRLLAGGLLLAAGAAVKATQAAAEDEAAQVKLASALKNATGARAKDIAGVEAWISAQGAALGVADDQLRPALESLVTATKDVGKAQALAGIAMDISARKGLSLESVAKALAKAQATGNVAALAKYGVATKDAEGKALSLEQVQKNLAKTYKGAAADAAETAAGKQQKLQVAMGELQEEIGAKLLPVMLKLASVGLQVVDWITKNQTAAAAIIGTLAGVLAIVKLVSIATTIWSTVTKIHTAVMAAFNLVMAANPVLLVVLAVAALIAVVVLVATKTQFFQKLWGKVWGAIGGPVMAAVGFIKNNWQKMLIILTGPVGIAVALIVKHWDTIKAGAVAVVGFIRDKFSAVKDALAGPVQKAKDLIGTAVDGVKSAIQSIKDKVDTVAGLIKSGLEGAFAPFGAVLSVIQSVIDKVQSLIDKIKSIPNPDLPFVGRAATGSSGAGTSELFGGHTATRGNTYVTVNVPGGFVGDDRQLALKLQRLLGDESYRFA